MPVFTRNFKELTKEVASTAGGKGASLGEMTKAGIPVPPGFVVLTDAFEQFLKETDLNVEIDAILHTVNHAEMHTIENASEKIQTLIKGVAMPEDIAREVKEKFKKLDAEFVAVRSSATAEDSVGAAWAGQLDSFLNTTGEELLKNVQNCWASLFTPRAIFYRFEKGLHDTHISVAVVVQAMVESEVSGIAFSVHPVTEDRNQLIIEAGLGLGEAIVSGQITPDSYVVEKSPRRIIDKNISEQTRALYRATLYPSKEEPTEARNRWKELSGAEGEKQKLSDQQILVLSELVLKIEGHYGFPCDIEWALRDGRFAILQSRPITTLSGGAKSLSPSDGFGRQGWRTLKFRKLGQWGTLPLDCELWHTADTSVYFEEKFGIWREELMICIRDAEYSQHAYVPTRFVEKLHERIRELTASNAHGLEAILRTFYSERTKTVEALHHLNPKDISALSDDALVALYRKNRDLAHRIVVYDQFTWLAEEYWLPRMDKVLIEEAGLRKDSPEYSAALFALIKPREISTTLREKLAVIEEAVAIQDGSETREKAAKKLARSFGWMPVLAYGTPWDSEWYESELQNVLAKDGAVLAKEQRELTDYTAIRDRDFKQSVAQLGISPADQQIFVDFGLAIDVRNEAEYAASVAGFYVLPLYEEFMRRLNISITELRTLFEDEIVACIRGERKVGDVLKSVGRMRAWTLNADRKERIDFTSGEAEEVFAFVEGQNNTSLSTGMTERRGITANVGKASGRVCLVPSPEYNHRVQQGDILIAYSTMVDNLPAMKRAAAFVTESGGLTCHAAVVAREFKVPCIVGMKGAMSDFKDGDMVEVDANNGIIRLLKM